MAATVISTYKDPDTIYFSCLPGIRLMCKEFNYCVGDSDKDGYDNREPCYWVVVLINNGEVRTAYPAPSILCAARNL